MCQQCVDAVGKYFPDLKGKDVADLLMECTSFPMGEPDQIRAQLAELRAKTDGTLDGAKAVAYYTGMDRAMMNYRTKYSPYPEWTRVCLTKVYSEAKS